MLILCALLWGGLVVFVMYATNKYYVVPKLLNKQIDTAEVLADSSAESMKSESTGGKVEEDRKSEIDILFLILCFLYSVVCGYFAFENSMTIISWIKMSIAFITLACVFVTDIKMYVIPNFCSYILLIGRIVMFLCELVVDKNASITNIVGSFIIFIFSLVILIIISNMAKGGLGFGDIKIVSSLGFLCGIRSVLFTMFFALCVCAVVSTFFLLIRKKKLNDLLPLGPFIWIGFGISIIMSLI